MENTLTKKLPPMLTGNDLEAILTIAPEYDPDIITQDPATRLMALNQLYKVFVPHQDGEGDLHPYVPFLAAFSPEERK